MWRRGAVAKLYRSPPPRNHAVSGISMNDIQAGSMGAPINGVMVDSDKPMSYTNKLYELTMDEPTFYANIGNSNKSGEELGQTSEVTSSPEVASTSGSSSPSFSEQAQLTQHEYPPATETPYATIDKGGLNNPAFSHPVEGAEQGSSKV